MVSIILEFRYKVNDFHAIRKSKMANTESEVSG